jgi:hypothetical protein
MTSGTRRDLPASFLLATANAASPDQERLERVSDTLTSDFDLS